MFALLFQHKTNKSLYCYFFYLSGFLNRILRHTHLEREREREKINILVCMTIR